MSTVAISALPVGTSASGTDVFPFVQAGTTKQITYTGLFTNAALTTPYLGTPQSGILTNCTGLPISTGVSGLGANVATFLATPSSTSLASVMSDETGTGSLVFGTSPTIYSALSGFPAIKTSSFSLGATEDNIVCDGASANVVITFPSAASWRGRAIRIKNLSGTYTVISAASDIVPLIGGAAGTAILAATAGKFATVVSNGSNWEIMAAN